MLGRIVGQYGAKGWVKVFSYTDPREAILEYDCWFLKREGGWQETRVAEGRRHGKSVVARLAGCDDRDQATELMGCDIAIERNALPEPGEGRYYWTDLEGLQVVRRDGTVLGRVAHLLETGANDVLVTEGEVERLIPFIADKVILDVDLAAGVITVDWDWD